MCRPIFVGKTRIRIGGAGGFASKSAESKPKIGIFGATKTDVAAIEVTIGNQSSSAYLARAYFRNEIKALAYI